MKSVIAMKVSSTHGSCRLPLCAHNDWYSTNGSRCASSRGCCKPSARKSPAIAGPTLGSCSKVSHSCGRAALRGLTRGPKFIAGIGAQAAEGTIVVEGAPNAASSAYKHADKLFRAAHGQEADFFASMAYDHLMGVALAIQAAKGDSSGEAIKANLRKVTNPPGKIVGTWAEAAPPWRATMPMPRPIAALQIPTRRLVVARSI